MDDRESKGIFKIFDPPSSILDRKHQVFDMTTHSIQFGHRSDTPGRVHSHSHSIPRTQKFGNHFATVKPKPSDDQEHEELVKQTQKWVSQTFYGELMKQMHNSPF